MDIALAAEDLAFRDEVRNFLDTEFDAEMQAHLKSRGSKGMVEWQEALRQRLGCAQLACRARRYWLDCDTEIYLGIRALTARYSRRCTFWSGHGRQRHHGVRYR